MTRFHDAKHYHSQTDLLIGGLRYLRKLHLKNKYRNFYPIIYILKHILKPNIKKLFTSQTIRIRPGKENH